MPGRLNVFQRTMLLWNELHPYNCVHLVRIFAALDVPQLRSAINRTLTRFGLGKVALSPDLNTICYENGAANYEVKVLQLGEDPQAALAAEATRQMNDRFASGQSFQPFRFLAAREVDSFFFGLVYFHAVADGASVTQLLKNIVEAYLEPAEHSLKPISQLEFQNVEATASRSGRPSKTDSSAMVAAIPEQTYGETAGLELYPHAHDRFLVRDPGLFVRKLWAIAAQFCALRRARRVPCGNPLEMTNAVEFFSLAPDDLPALLQSAKAWEVTLNDVFLALLLKCVMRAATVPPPNSRRTKLAVGCIVNLRKELGLARQRVFGLFLGLFVVACERDGEMPLRELARAVRAQTARIKASRLAVATPIELRFANWLFQFFSLERRAKFYHKNHPLWGGLTNMNLDSIWQPQAGERPVEYFRAVSTGPATPLVFSISTVGGRATVGLSYRTACYSPAQVDQVKMCFRESVRDLRNQA